MPNNHAVLTSLFNDTANAIRFKRGITNSMIALNFPNEINAIVNVNEGTSSANAVAGDILAPKTAYVNGSKLTGTIPTRTVSNLTVSGAKITTQAGYYATDVNKSVSTASLVAGNISGTAYLETTGDYGFQVNVNVPTGYHAGGTVTKNFTTGIFPAPESKATANRMLTGYSLYDEDGKLITGNMPNRGAQNSTIATQGGTYTIPEGYHNGSGVITASFPNVTITTSSKNTGSSFTPTLTYDATNSNYKFGGSSTASFTANFNVTANGYATNLNNSQATNSGTVSATGTLTKVSVEANIESAGSRKPSLSLQSVPSGVTNAAAGAATTTAPSSGYYVAIRSGANTTTAYGNIKSVSAGYSDGANVTKTRSSGVTTGAAQSDIYYIPVNMQAGPGNIKAASGTGSATITAATYAYNATAGNYGVTGSKAISGSAYREIDTAGYLAKDNTAGSVTGTASLAANVAKTTVTTAVSGTISRKPVIAVQATPSGVTNAANGAATTTKPSSGIYVTVASSANTSTATATVSSVTTGYSDGTNYDKSQGTATGGAAASDTFYIPVNSAEILPAGISFSGPAVQMSVANATGRVTASSTTSTGTFYYANINTAGYLTAGKRSTTGVFTSTGNTLQLNTKAGQTINVSTNTKIINAGQFATGDIYAKPTVTGSINRILIKPYRVVLLSDQYPEKNKSTNPSVVFGTGVGYCTISYGYPQTSATITTTSYRYYQILQNHDWWAVYDDGTMVNLVDIAALGNLVEATTTCSVSGSLSSYNWIFFNSAGSYQDSGLQIHFYNGATTRAVYNEQGNTETVRGCFDYISCNTKSGSSGTITIGISSVKINSIQYPISVPWGYTYASEVANPQMLSKRYGSNMVLSAGQSYYRVNAGDTIVGLVNVGVTNNYAVNDNYVYPLFLSTNSAAVEHYDSTHTAHKTYVTSITYNGTTWYCGDVIDPGTTTSSTTHYLGYNLTNPSGSSVSSVNNAIPRAGVGFVPLYGSSTYKIQAIQAAAKRILDYYYYG